MTRSPLYFFQFDPTSPDFNPILSGKLSRISAAKSIAYMCKSRSAVDAAEPNLSPRSSRRSSARRLSNASRTTKSAPVSDALTSTSVPYSVGSSYGLDISGATASISSGTSLSSLRESLPENPHIYDFAEIRSATNGFLAKRHSLSSSPCWRCNLRGKDVIVFQRKFRRSIETPQLRERLSLICKSHHVSIIKLLGASISGDYIYLVYDFVSGASLSDCLRNPKNPNFTVLSTWMSRMQIATDLADGLDYIHNSTGLSINLMHKHIKSSSIIVTEPSFNAKICQFGAADLCGETVIGRKGVKTIRTDGSDEITEEHVSKPPVELRRSDSGASQFEGVTGYMSPEFRSTGVATQKSDVYAFGIVILELLTGDEPVKFKLDRTSREYQRISVIETATNAIEGGRDQAEVRLRRWVDGRLNDSFPVAAAEKLTRVALECVQVDPDRRPDMRRVAHKISKLYLESSNWQKKIKLPANISVSLAPR